jgi:hypothetical protein
LISDTGTVENYLYSMGTSYNAAFSDFNAVTRAIDSKISDFVNTGAINGGESYFAVNMTSGQSIVGTAVGSLGSYTNKPDGLGLWSLRQPNNITMSVRRLGSITLNGTSVLATTASPSNVSSVQLEKYGSGFIASNAVAENGMTQIDPFRPLT